MTDRDPSGTATTLRHFSESLPMMLLRAREAVMVRFRSMLRDNGLTEQQWRVLRALGAAGRMDATQVAEATYLLAPSVTRILRDLVSQRLVTTTNDDADQRRKMVELSSDGAARIALLAPLSEAIYAEMTERFGSDRLVALQDLLRELQDELRGRGLSPGRDRTGQPRAVAAVGPGPRAPPRRASGPRDARLRPGWRGSGRSKRT